MFADIHADRTIPVYFIVAMLALDAADEWGRT